MREMILAGTKEERSRAVAKFASLINEKDFVGIFTELKGIARHDPVARSAATEFLPNDQRPAK